MEPPDTWETQNVDEFRQLLEFSWERYTQDEPDEPENYWFPEGDDLQVDDSMSTYDADDYENCQTFWGTFQ